MCDGDFKEGTTQQSQVIVTFNSFKYGVMPRCNLQLQQQEGCLWCVPTWGGKFTHDII